MRNNTEVIVKKIYPIIEECMKKKTTAYVNYMGKFISNRHEDLYDIAPCRRIYYTLDDSNLMNSTLGINNRLVQEYLKDAYYASISSFNPAAAKDDTTVIILCILRYFYLKKDEKNLELAIINLAFSGKMYPSIHFGMFKKVQPVEYRWVMEYVVNEMLTGKFDLKVHGNIIGAIKSISKTWIDTYSDRLKDFDDADVVYLIQQIHDRIKSFMKNIAALYYKAYENKSQYINYSSDDYSEDNYRLADTDNLVATRIVDKAINNISTMSVNYKYCRMASDINVRPQEIKEIVENTIKNDTKALSEVKEYINLIVFTYFANSNIKDVRTVEFIKYTTQPKPNSKDPNIIRLKEITERWLLEGSKKYQFRRKRDATKASYNRCLLMYFTLVIHFSAL